MGTGTVFATSEFLLIVISLLHSLQSNKRNLARRLRLMINNHGPQLQHMLPLRIIYNAGDSLEGLIAYLDGDLWMGYKIVIFPVTLLNRVVRCCSLLPKDLRHRRRHQVRRDRKSDTIGLRIRLRIDRRQCWNADQLSLQIDQGTPAIARIDRSIGLDRILNCGSS